MLLVRGGGIAISDHAPQTNLSNGTDFSTAAVGLLSIAHTFVIENAGDGQLVLPPNPVQLSGSIPADFPLQNQPSTTTTLSAGQSTSFDLAFQPSMAWLEGAAVVVNSNDTVHPQYTFTVQGTGVNTGKAAITIECLGNDVPQYQAVPTATNGTDFGTATVSTGTITRTFVIRNTGSAPLQLPGQSSDNQFVKIGGTNIADFFVTVEPPQWIDPGSTGTFAITFDPVGSGVRTAQITVITVTDSVFYPFNIQGTATGPDAPEINVRGNAQNVGSASHFCIVQGTTMQVGSVAVGTTMTPALTFYVENLGGQPLHLTGVPHVQLSGSAVSDFFVASQPADTLATGTLGVATVTLHFCPSAAGLRTATVSISSDDDNEPTYRFFVTGIGNGQDAWDPADDTAAGATQLPAPTLTPLLHGPHVAGYAADTSDYFQVPLTSGQIYDFKLTNASGTGSMSLYPNITAAGTAVATASGDGSTSQIAIRHAATLNGTYTLRLSGNSGSLAYTLSSALLTTSCPHLAARLASGQELHSSDSSGDPYVDFGAVNPSAGTSSTSVTFTLQNAGNADLHFIGSPRTSIVGQYGSEKQFRVVSSPPVVLSAGGACTVQIVYEPSAGGTHFITIGWATDDPIKPEFVLRAYGTMSGYINYQNTNKTQPLLELGLGNCNGVTYSPDGKRLATVAAHGAVIWDAATGQLQRFLRNTGGNPTCVAFSPNGSRVAIGNSDYLVRIYDLASGSELYTFGGAGGIKGVCFSPDGSRVAIAGFNSSIWDPITGQKVREFANYFVEGWQTYGVAYSPDGTKILFGGGSSPSYAARLWDVSTGNLLKSFGPHSVQVISVSYATNDRISLATYGDGAEVWDASTGNKLFSVPLPWSYNSSNAQACLSSNGSRLLVGGTQPKVYDATTGNLIASLPTSVLPSYGSATVAITPDASEVAVAAVDGPVRLYDATNSSPHAQLIGHTNGLFSSLSADGTRAFAAGLGGGNPTTSIGAYSTVTGSSVGGFGGLQTVNGASISADGRLVITGDSDGTATLRSMEDGHIVRQFVSVFGTTFIARALLTPDGTVALFSNGSSLKAYSCSSGILLWSIATNDIPKAISPEGTRLLGYYGISYGIRSMATGTQLCRINSSDGYNFCFSANGASIAVSGSGPPAAIYDSTTGNCIAACYGHSASVNGLAFTPDGSRLITVSSDISARLWNSSTGTEIKRYVAHSEFVQSVACSPDGTRILTGGGDGSAILWDMASGQVADSYGDRNSTLYKVAFLPTGDRIILGDGNAGTTLWEIQPPHAMVVAGGGNFAGNGIAQQTNELAAYAFKTLKGRGYAGNDIQYLSAFGNRDADEDGVNDVDGQATLESFHNTLTSSFATASGRLLILMLDHGYRTDNFMAFRINETQALPSTTLNTWLNDLQTNYPVDVTLVVDSCYSGKIVDDCSTAPAGRKRIVISSTTRDAEAVFCPAPDLSSFMYTFLGSAYMGNSIGEAFRAGKRFFEAFPVANQVPQIADGSTTTTNADREFFGKSWAYGVQSTTDANQFFPAFSSVTTTQTVSPGTAVPLSVTLLEGQDPTNVTCVVRPPAPSVLSGDPITTLPQLAMVRKSNNPATPEYLVWETTSPIETFPTNGSYTVSFSAQFANERVSNPAFTNVTVSAGTDPDQTPIRSILAVGSTTNADMSSALQGLGPYAYSTYLSRFADNSGVHHPEWIDYYANYTDANKDGAASSANVTNSINNLPASIGRVYVHLIGDSAAQGGVRMASGDILSAAALDSVLDALQSRQTCTVVLIVDAPYSGAFLNTCKATGVQQRVVMTSGKQNEQAMFMQPPLKTSFSEKVLGAGLQGNDLATAFDSGKKFFANFKRSITPQLDDNGSGSFSASDGALAKSIYLGRRFAFAGDDGSGLPFVLDATTTQTVSPGTYVQYSTTLIEGVLPSRVYLQLTPDSTSDLTPITQVPTVDLTRDGATNWTWSANFYAPTPPGTYAMVLYADYPNAAQVKPTQPQYTGLIVSGTPTTSPIKDMDNDGYEDAVELRAGTSPLDPAAHPSGFPYDSAADSDGDGFKDFYEYELGYDPSSASSYPSLSDINGDGSTNGADAIILKRIAVGTVQATDYSIANMDLNRDGLINGADAIILQRYVVHTVTALPTN